MIKPRIRSIKPEVVTDRKLAQCSRDARLTFVYLWTQSDDDGLQFGIMRTLVGSLYPHDHDVTPEILGKWLAELAKVGLIEWLETVDGTPVIRITGWQKHQRIDKHGKSLLLPMLQNNRHGIPETLALPINDLRSTTHDLRPTTYEQLEIPEAGMSVGFYQAKIVEAWNAGAQRRGFAKVMALKGSRLAALQARLNENGWFANAMLAISYLVNDPWRVANPDSVRFNVFVKPGKVEEYVERSAVKQNGHTSRSRGGAREDVDRNIHDDLSGDAGRITEQHHG